MRQPNRARLERQEEHQVEIEVSGRRRRDQGSVESRMGRGRLAAQGTHLWGGEKIFYLAAAPCPGQADADLAPRGLERSPGGRPTGWGR